MIKTESGITDAELVARIIATNDAQLFGEVYNRYAKRVYNKCLSFVHNAQEAEDLTHDIFLKLFLSLRKFSGKSTFSTWLYSLTYNFCLNYIQRNKPALNSHTDIEGLSEIPDNDDSELLQIREDRLEKALEGIPVEDKMILFMKFQDDMSITDIASALGIGESASKMRIKRAKARAIQVYGTL